MQPPCSYASLCASCKGTEPHLERRRSHLERRRRSNHAVQKDGIRTLQLPRELDCCRCRFSPRAQPPSLSTSSGCGSGNRCHGCATSQRSSSSTSLPWLRALPTLRLLPWPLAAPMLLAPCRPAAPALRVRGSGGRPTLERTLPLSSLTAPLLQPAQPPLRLRCAAVLPMAFAGR